VRPDGHGPSIEDDIDFGPSHGNLAFTIPASDAFMEQIMLSDDREP
jgi:hypothetical protein